MSDVLDKKQARRESGNGASAEFLGGGGTPANALAGKREILQTPLAPARAERGGGETDGGSAAHLGA